MSLAFFAEMALKSAVIAVIGLLFASLLKYRSAADRAAVLRLAIGLVLLLPLVSAFVPALQVEVAAAPALEPALVSASEAVPSAASSPVIAAPAQGGGAGVFEDPAILIAIAYLAGLAMALARLLAGLVTLRRWTRAAEPLGCSEWAAAFERVRRETGLGPRARLLLSNDAPAPLSWGWRRPVILIDPDTARRPQDAEAILEHEAAHIVRSDWPALLVARAASALFWFNPLVWALERSLVQNTEEAADSSAVRRVEPAHYAQILLGCADQLCRSALPANSMSGSAAIGRRIKAILDSRFRDTPSGSALAMLAMGLCVAFAGPVSAMKLVAATINVPIPPAAPVPVVSTVPTVAALAEEIRAAVTAEVSASVETAVTEAVADIEVEAPAEAVAEAAATIAEAAAETAVAASLAAAATAPPGPPAPPAPPRSPAPPAQLLDVDTLVKLQIHGVSSRFINEMAEAGYSRLSADQLVAMRIHGVDADLARRAAAQTGTRLSPDELVNLAIHGRVLEATRHTKRHNRRD